MLVQDDTTGGSVYCDACGKGPLHQWHSHSPLVLNSGEGTGSISVSVMPLDLCTKCSTERTNGELPPEDS